MKTGHIAAILLAASALTAVGTVSAQTPQKEPTTKDRLDQVVATVTGDPLRKADTDMKHVMDELAKLNPKPIKDDMPAAEARQQPTPTDAVKALLKKENREKDGNIPGVISEDITYQGAAGPVKARVYKPEGATGNLPVVLYFRGGGWVIANLDVYDATPRALAKQLNAIVISADYRMGPEHKFPAAHEDAIAAYKWVLANAQKYNGDPKNIVLVGESAGGNLAINVSIAARDQNLQPPKHQVLVYPVAGVDMNTDSYKANSNAVPLNKPMMEWFVRQISKDKNDTTNDPRIDLIGKADVSKLPSTTIITAEIDPLRDDGAKLAEKLRAANVKVNHQDYAGSTHEFFGMAAAVADAKEAQALAVREIKQALSQNRADTAQ